MKGVRHELAPRGALGLVLVLVLIVGVIAVRSWAAPTMVTVPASAAAEPSGQPAQVTVHVTGAVLVPGVYQLPAGSRIDDAIWMAGGFTNDANEAGLNRAQILTDGAQIAVPVLGEISIAGGSGGATSGLVNINTASASELEALPGIGPALARAIITWREENGGFREIVDLDRVSGIGPKLMERLAPLVTL